MYDEEIPYHRISDDTTSNTDARRSDWATAKGLQKVDNLSTSRYLEDVEQGHIAGHYSSSQAASLVRDYYRAKDARTVDPHEREADLVSVRIVELLEAGGFAFKPTLLSHIHGTLFTGLIDKPYDFGWRDYNITKAERILAGETVQYAPWQLIGDNLAYDFNTASPATLLRPPLTPGGLAAFVKFISNIWQTHAFVEGNTRTVAVFCILLLRSVGIAIDNEPFARHSLYFRDALVRANFSSIARGIEEDQTFLAKFFENLVCGSNHELRDRELYCDELFKEKGMPLPSELFEDHERA